MFIAAATTAAYKGIERGFAFTNEATSRYIEFSPDYPKMTKSIALWQSQPDRAVFLATEIFLKNLSGMAAAFEINELNIEYQKHGNSKLIHNE